jgi:CRISPR-associated endoribonuclease Cas6
MKSSLMSKARFFLKRIKKANIPLNEIYVPKYIQGLMYSKVEVSYKINVHNERFSPFAIHRIHPTSKGVFLDIAFLRGEFLLYLQQNMNVGDRIMIGEYEHVVEKVLLHSNNPKENLGVLDIRRLGASRKGEIVHKLTFLSPYSARRYNQKDYPNLLPSLETIVSKTAGRMEFVDPELFPFNKELVKNLPYHLTIEDVFLKSTSYMVEKKFQVRGVVGWLTIRYVGDTKDTMYMKWLEMLDFISYAGLGQKTTLGMGHTRIEVIEREGENNRGKLENHVSTSKRDSSWTISDSL